MNIQEMHELFRTLGQKNGMQNIRAILPESIDDFLNVAIVEKCRSVILSNTSTNFKDDVTDKFNHISPINYIRTLYKEDVLNNITKDLDKDYYSINLNNNKDVMFYTSANVRYSDNKITNCRIIEGDKIYETLNDYCNRATWDYPIISVFSKNDDSNFIKLYTGDSSKIPKELYINFIKIPQKVKYHQDVNKRINCNLPEYTHREIVTTAVSLYFNSLNLTNKNINQ